MSRLFAGIVCVVILSPVARAHDEFPHWKTLFDGKSLKNWTYAKDRRKGVWKVEEGTMTQVDNVDYCTIEEFEDFLVEVEFKSMTKGSGNSGVYLRGVYEVQILNATHGKPVDKLRAGDGGGIYGKQPPKANPHNEQGQWNKYTILMHGDEITVWINGVLVQDSVKMTGKTGGAMPVSRHPDRLEKPEPLTGRRGPIMLQGDHDKMWFRNIRLLEIPQGWKPLWNGKDLSEFTMMNKDRDAKINEFWKVENNAFYNPRWGYEKNRGYDLWTKKSFGNFYVHYEYKSDPTKHGGNSGFYLRDQWEIQIDGSQSLKSASKDGSLYSKKTVDVLARNKDPRDWNTIDAKVIGMKIWVWQNNKLIHDGVVLDTRTDNHGAKTDKFSRAPFKLQGDHGQVWFRNMFIKELPDDAK